MFIFSRMTNIFLSIFLQNQVFWFVMFMQSSQPSYHETHCYLDIRWLKFLAHYFFLWLLFKFYSFRCVQLLHNLLLISFLFFQILLNFFIISCNFLLSIVWFNWSTEFINRLLVNWVPLEWQQLTTGPMLPTLKCSTLIPFVTFIYWGLYWYVDPLNIWLSSF